MRILGSIMLLTGGLSAVAYAYFPVASFDEHNLVKLMQIQSPTGRQAALAGSRSHSATSPQRSFAPRNPHYALSVASLATPPAATAATPAITVDGDKRAWRAIISPEASSARPANDDYAGHVALAREIQRELKRLGCYEGDADGDWKAASRRAMTAFLGKINASLPVERPDNILLTLLQGHADKACGVSCPSGQAVSSDGRCIAKSVVASAGSGTKDVKSETRWEARITPPAPVAVDRVRSAALAYPTAVASADEADFAVRPALPGRMSIGAPVSPLTAPAPVAVTRPQASLPADAIPGGEPATAQDEAQRRYSSIGREQTWEPRAVARPAPKPRYERREAYAAPRRPARRKLNVTDLMRQLNGF